MLTLLICFPCDQEVGLVYKDELELETYIRSDCYGVSNSARSVMFYEICI